MLNSGLDRLAARLTARAAALVRARLAARRLARRAPDAVWRRAALLWPDLFEG